MKWKKINYKTGDLKTKEFFAWWPVHIKNEYRWLERVVVVYKYQEYDVQEWLFGACREYSIGRWEKIDFFEPKNAIEVFIEGEDSP